MIASNRRKRWLLRFAGRRQQSHYIGDQLPNGYWPYLSKPGYVSRAGYMRPRKLRQEAANFARWDVDHALSDCCGRGFNEHGELVYPWAATDDT